MNLYEYYVNGNKEYIVAESYAKAEELIIKNDYAYGIRSIALVQSGIIVQGVQN